MLRIPLEGASAKRDIAGMAQLLRELRRGPSDEDRKTPLYFVSASPKQLRPVIEHKLSLDGIGFDGSTFKDWGRVLRHGRIYRFREQLGFKLTALLANRAVFPVGGAEILLGDDLESDALAYALYADALSERLSRTRIAEVLREHGVLKVDIRAILEVIGALPRCEGVATALIRLERHHDTDMFLRFAPGVLGCAGAVQMAAASWRLGAISKASVVRVARAVEQHHVARSVVAARVRDLVRRAILAPVQGELLWEALREEGLVRGAADFDPIDPRWAAAWEKRAPWTPPIS